MGTYFSLAQWQELELQALIYKHMLAGSSIPPELLHLLKKTLLPPPSFQQYSHYHSALLQSGHWGRTAMDPEPGRCRRTDGKKWRCSKDVVAGHKYCDRHMHRGRNRSRKPVELPQPPAATAFSVVPQPFSAATMMDCGTGTDHFDLSPPNHLLHLNQRPLDVVDTEKNKSIFGMQNEVSRDSKQGGERVLRHFFDDWPRPLQELPNAAIDTGSGKSSTCLSISSTPASDFSLKLSTGNAENTERDRIQLNWASGWGASPMGGGPLAEALRSSMTSDSSPTSVLHNLPRNSTSETSYVSN